jgi:hypothetical protein
VLEDLQPCLGVLLACASLPSFAARVAASLAALRGCLAAAASLQDTALLLPMLQLVHSVVAAVDARFSFPDTKDLCNALVATLPGDCGPSSLHTEPGGAPAFLASQQPEGAYDPSDEALACSQCALVCIVALLSRGSAPSPPWVTLHCAVLHRVAASLASHTYDACWCTAASESQQAQLLCNSQKPQTLSGQFAQLCTSVCSAHERVLQTGVTPSKLLSAGARQSSLTGPVQLLAVLQASVEHVLLPLYAAGLASAEPGAIGEPAFTIAQMWGAIAQVLEVSLGLHADDQPSAETRQAQQAPPRTAAATPVSASGSLWACRMAEACIAAGALMHVFECVPSASLR